MVTPGLASRPLLRWLIASACIFALNSGATPAEKSETWTEIRSPHFIVASNGSEKQARRAADEFEQIRAVFLKAFPKVRVDPGQPIIILAAKNENTLKALLPEFWERKGHAHPAGIFVPGQEKHYVALRMDAAGDNPYHTLYHEYVHLLVGLNYRRLPVWLDEGFAEFYGNTTIEEKFVGLGRIDPSHLQLLNQSALLPLEVLLKVDHKSPYYNEASKASIFYAESWALVHYLLTDEQARKTNPVETFIALLRTQLDEVEAARRAFGDLKQIQKKLEEHVRQSSFRYARMKAPAEIAEKDYVARVLSPAESSARRGDFHLHLQRMAEARILLEEALHADPNLALAHESMGFLYYRLGERDEAAKWFAQAVKLDSRSYLAHYFHAVLMMQGTLHPDSFAEAEASLQRAIALNPNFAPAYATLASFYSAQQETLENALAAARKATELEPGEPQYYLNLAHVLLRMQRIEEARAIGQSIAAAAKSPEMRAAAESFLQEVTHYEEYLAHRKQAAEEARASREQLQAYLRTQGGAKAQTNSEAQTPPTEPSRPTASPTLRHYSAFGRITKVSCAAPPALQITLNLGALVMRLQAADSSKLNFLTTTWKPPAKFNPCTQLIGLSAQVSYTLVQQQSYDGEIISIEVRK